MAIDFSLRQLEYVVAIADTLGFHKAATRCGVSQPTLSAQVQQLESALGVPLFERDRKRVLVTAAGEQLIARARRVLLEVSDLVDAAAGAHDPLVGVLRVGLIPTVAPYILPKVMPRLRRAFPRLRLALREEKTADLAQQLHEGKLDAAILALGPDLGDVEHVKLATDDFAVALPRGHALTRKKRLAMGDLEGVRILLLDDGHCFRAQALELCERAGAEEATFRATSLATLVQMVAAGEALTVLPTLAVSVESERAPIEVRPFVRPSPSRTLALIWRVRSPLAGAFRPLAAEVRAGLV